MWQPEGIVNRKLGGEYHQPSTNNHQPHPTQPNPTQLFSNQLQIRISIKISISNDDDDYSNDGNANDNNGNDADNAYNADDKDGGNDGNDLEARRRRPWRVTSPRESQTNTSEMNCELNCEKLCFLQTCAN